MASTSDLIDSGAEGEQRGSEIFSALLVEAAYARSIMLPLVQIEDMRGATSLVSSHLNMPKLAATSPGDGADFANTAFDTTPVTATMDESGLMVCVSDIMVRRGAVKIVDYFTSLGRALGEYWDTDLTAEFADFTLSETDTGNGMTADDFLGAIYDNENANNQHYGDLVAVVHPITKDDLRKDIEASTGTIWGAGGGDSFVGANSQGTPLFGVPVFTSSTCASVNSNADRQGAMWPRGASLVTGIGMEPQSRRERDESLRATELIVVAEYSHECINTDGGSKLIFDHE